MVRSAFFLLWVLNIDEPYFAGRRDAETLCVTSSHHLRPLLIGGISGTLLFLPFTCLLTRCAKHDHDADDDFFLHFY